MEKRSLLKWLKLSPVDVSFGVIRLLYNVTIILYENELSHSVLYISTCTVYLILYQIPLFSFYFHFKGKAFYIDPK